MIRGPYIAIGNRRGASEPNWQATWGYIDNSGNVSDLVNTAIKVTITSDDYNLALIKSDGSNLYFSDSSGFLHSFINYKCTDYIECYVKVSCSALIRKGFSLELQDHVFANDYVNVMVRRTAHASTNMLYPCSDAHDSLAVGGDITLGNGASFVSTKYGTVLSLDGDNDYATVDIIKTIPSYGGFGFNFSIPDNVNFDGVSEHYIFTKIWDANNYVQLSIGIGGKINLYWGFTAGHTGSWTSTLPVETGKILSFYMRWTPLTTILYINNSVVDAIMYKVAASPSNTQTVVFGSYSTTNPYNCKCYIWDIEYNNASLPFNYQISRGENILPGNRYQSDKIVELSTSPASPTAGTWWGEPSIIIKNDIIYCYFQKSYSDADHSEGHNIFCLITSNDFGLTWSAPTTLFGYNSGVENAVGIFRPFVFDDGGKTYVTYKRHNEDVAYIRESVDGTTFTNPQVFLAATYGPVENCCVINDNGVYKGIAEVGVGGKWVGYYIEGNSLTTMAYGSLQTSLKRTANNFCYGASFLKKIGSKYYLWGQRGSNDVSILPTEVYFSHADDPGNNTWITDPYPTFPMDHQYADDQTADSHIAEYGGKTYFVVVDSNNSPGPFLLRFYKYDGTLTQFITDTTFIVQQQNPSIADKTINIVSANVPYSNQTKVVLINDSELDSTSVPATSAFAIAGKTVSNVAILGKTITLTTDNIYKGDSISVVYTQPVTNKLKSIEGNVYATFTKAVTNSCNVINLTFVVAVAGVKRIKLKGINGADPVYVYWGDGSDSTLTMDGTVQTLTRTYAASGTYAFHIDNASNLLSFDFDGTYSSTGIYGDIGVFSYCTALTSIRISNTSTLWTGSLDNLSALPLADFTLDQAGTNCTGKLSSLATSITGAFAIWIYKSGNNIDIGTAPLAVCKNVGTLTLNCSFPTAQVDAFFNSYDLVAVNGAQTLNLKGTGAGIANQAPSAASAAARTHLATLTKTIQVN